MCVSTLIPNTWKFDLLHFDPRPVLAIFEVDMYRVDSSKRSKVKEETALALGPPDPTIVVENEVGGVNIAIQDLLLVLKEYGEVVLVR